MSMYHACGVIWNQRPKIHRIRLLIIVNVMHLTKTHWTAPSVSLSQTKVDYINLNDRPQMKNDTENEIGRGRSLFPSISGL